MEAGDNWDWGAGGNKNTRKSLFYIAQTVAVCVTGVSHRSQAVGQLNLGHKNNAQCEKHKYFYT